jgi:hypothetical protein
MKKFITGFLIDPVLETVTAVQVDPNSIDSIYKLIDADIFDAARFNNKGDAVFVDDEGLLKNHDHFFIVPGYPQPLTGKGLVLGRDSEGNSTAPTVTREWLEDKIIFLCRIISENETA